MNSSAPDTDPVRAWFLRGPTVRALRELLTPDPSAVAVVLAPGVPLPEVTAAGAWRQVEGLRVAALPLEAAAELAALRSPGSARRILGAAAGEGCGWVMFLENARAVTWAVPLRPPPRVPLPAGRVS
jgi:hypothetical protein